MSFKDPAEQLKTLKKGTDTIISEEELFTKFKRSSERDEPLRIKAGFDPTAPDLHLGHCVLLKKLRDFQDFGHKVIFLIGDFTARIGDPTGMTETRPPLTDEEIKRNAETYVKQVFKILRKDLTEVVFNSEWMEKMNIIELLRLTSMINIARLLERDDFKNRHVRGTPISLKEFIYPLIQAYDSVMTKADVEFGGTDQIFNILLGRDLQKNFDQEPQVAILLPILEGTDGVKKMSKTLGNYIGIEDSPNDLFGKVMSISDDMMWKYYDLLTNKTDKETELLKNKHPMDAKKELAFELTSWLHGEDYARLARADFEKKFSEREFPEEVREKILKKNSLNSLLDLVSKASDSLNSRGEAKRLISQGGLTINNKKYSDFRLPVPDEDILELKIGKKEFVRVIME